MNEYSEKRRGLQPGNPIANVLVVIVGSLVIAASLVLGFLAFLVLASIVMILAAIIGIRVWWFKRKMQKAGRNSSSPSGAIEGEFVVIEHRDRRDD